ncbi:hypothetical protein EMPG_14891 [Blastomyces silverae]|uniref:Uncharacterized protein n=1 Tax=Blastomyces silverae TaxID=2060906 RepID=A0A0H1BF87_9EURO|nr:hypothetical protein EMPG_14891 [Blastomyces silverae]
MKKDEKENEEKKEDEEKENEEKKENEENEEKEKKEMKTDSISDYHSELREEDLIPLISSVINYL